VGLFGDSRKLGQMLRISPHAMNKDEKMDRGHDASQNTSVNLPEKRKSMLEKG
jgi:hypothetical protein